MGFARESRRVRDAAASRFRVSLMVVSCEVERSVRRDSMAAIGGVMEWSASMREL